MAETSLRSSDARWRAAIAARGLGTFSLQGERVELDARGRALLGFADDAADDAAGDDAAGDDAAGDNAAGAPTLSDVVARLHVDDRAAFSDGVAAVAGGTSAEWRGDVRCVATRPERCLAIVLVAAPDAGPHAADDDDDTAEAAPLGVVEDVTEQRRVSGALARAEHARDVIAGALAHDLRAPVFNIVMAADLLLKQQRVAEGASLRRITGAARRMTMKVEELVYFARISIGDGVELAPAQLDLRALAERCGDRATLTGATDAATPERQTPVPPPAPRAPADVKPSVVVSARGNTVGSWDGSMIGAALLTLIDNALRHGRRPAVARVEIDGTADDDVAVTVQNDGVIRPEIIAMMFELVRAPRTAAAASGGLGLGLFNARQIAFAHGGELTVQSTEATGTVFALRMPRHVLVGDQGARRASATLERPGTGGTSTAPRVAEEAPPGVGNGPGQALQQRAPRAYWLLLDRYTRLLEQALHRRTFKYAGEAIPDELARLADELGALHTSAREVADLHAAALRRASLLAPAAKAQALVTEGRMLSLELMGRLLSHYRKRAGPPATKGDPP